MDLQAAIERMGNPWMATLLAALIGVALALIGCAIADRVLRRLARRSVVLTTVLERSARSARVVIVLVVLQFIWTAAPDDLRALPAVSRITTLLLITAVTWFLVRTIGAVADAIIRLHPTNVAENVEARRVATQTRLLARALMFMIAVVGFGAALMTFPDVRQLGASLLASAGVAGLVAGIAARPVLGNLIAGLQIALTQPIRLDDAVIIEGEWGHIEEINATYVVVKTWDERRLVVPLQWVIEHPFQNWTRRNPQLLGTVLLWLDYRVPLAPLRAELERVCKSAPEWDGRTAVLQVVEANERAMQVRVLVSSRDAATNWDLRCRVREALIDYLQRQMPDGLPRVRAEIEEMPRRASNAGRASRDSARSPLTADSRAHENA